MFCCSIQPAETMGKIPSLTYIYLYMPDNASDNKRIAKNTLFLYFRMMFTMVVQLYTSRVVLNTLGVVDYGIYNVVGGIVTMFTFMNSAMVNSTQRYLTFELGRDDTSKLKTVFATSLIIHALISFIVVLFAETIGLWFFYHKMVIPFDRMSAAMWVFQLSILTMVVQVMSMPYNSIIIAYERMNIFAFFSILEVSLKLAIVFILLIGSTDKLILYAILVASVHIFIRFCYSVYCKRHFEVVRNKGNLNWSLMKEMGSFAGWNLWGNLASTLMGTGLNLLLNIFFGPIVNAARAIAVQVESAITQFSSNFLMAVNPQITKFYAQKELSAMHTLIFRSSKLTFFLLLALSLPVMLETNAILELWLNTVPEYTVAFLRLLLFITLISATATPLMTAASATGNVKKYQSTIGGILLSIVPISYCSLKLGASPIAVYWVYLAVSIIAIIARLYIVRPMIQLSLFEYFRNVILRCAFVLLISCGFSYLVFKAIPDGIVFSLMVCLISSCVVIIVSFAIGLTRNEKSFVLEKCQVFTHKRFSR